jgi:hypothetical protein
MNVTAKFADGYTGYLKIVYELLSSYVTAPDSNVLVTVSVFENQYELHFVTVCMKV